MSWSTPTGPASISGADTCQPGYHDRAQINRDPELPRAFARRMKIDPATILAYGIRDWGREPYGGAGHLWRPGFEPWNVSDRLEAFSLTGRAPRTCTSAARPSPTSRDSWKEPCVPPTVP